MHKTSFGKIKESLLLKIIINGPIALVTFWLSFPPWPTMGHPIHLFLDKKALRDSQNGQKTSVIKELPEEIQIVILSRYFEPLNKVKLHCRGEAS